MSLPLNEVIVGDCVEVMRGWSENSVDCIVTDPPYGLGFMGKEWDKALPSVKAFEQMIRILKPGALAFVMSSPRQDVLWRMLSMLEGVGFQLKQSFISWIYKTGFPKSYDVSKGIDRKLGLEREVIGLKEANYNADIAVTRKQQGYRPNVADTDRFYKVTAPASDEAKKWSGWKSQTGLKPALECILMVNKPRSEKTIVDNVLRWGTGAINIDATRIPINSEIDDPRLGGKGKWVTKKPQTIYGGGKGIPRGTVKSSSLGRFPANLLVSDGSLDTGEKTGSGKFVSRKRDRGKSWREMEGLEGSMGVTEAIDNYGDVGDQSRYFDLDAWARHHGFLDVPKPSRAERDFGLKGRNTHVAVKPVKLMAYLIELGCPPDGVVLDPFLGSGTTCIAAKRLRRRWIGIEIDPEYADIAEARIKAQPIPPVSLDQFMKLKEKKENE